MGELEEMVLSANRNIHAGCSFDELLSKYEYLKVSASKPIEAPIPIVTAYNSIEICTRKSITTISGQSKGGKTALISYLLSSSIKTANGIDGCNDLVVSENIESKAVLHFDTEQSKYHHDRNFRNGVLKRARIEKEPHNFYSYNIRELNLKDYKQVVEEIFTATDKKHNGIHLAIIDGGADFVGSVNDEEEANAIVDWFESLAIKHDTAIILILHLNPNSDKERGHLGSQLQRKSESVLSITKDGDTSVLSAKLLRSGGNKDFPPIRYQFDTSKGYHVFLDASTHCAKESDLEETAKAVFTKPIQYSDAVKSIMDFEAVAERTAKSRIAKMVKLNLIDYQVSSNKKIYSLKTISDYEKPPF